MSARGAFWFTLSVFLTLVFCAPAAARRATPDEPSRPSSTEDGIDPAWGYETDGGICAYYLVANPEPSLMGWPESGCLPSRVSSTGLEECRLIEWLPRGIRCEDLPGRHFFERAPGGERCLLTRLEPPRSLEERDLRTCQDWFQCGWYIDPFARPFGHCPAGTPGDIGFTDLASPLPGSRLTLTCDRCL